MNIVIVENDKEIRIAITDIMLRHIVPDPCDDRIYGYRNGKIGYEGINIGSKCDLLIVDCSPETQDGLELIEKIKSDEKLREVPVIAISTYPIYEKRAMAVGANDFILKPFNIDEVLTKINRLLKTKNT